MNIVIAGDGEVGSYLAKMLTGKDHNITFISPQKDLLDALDSHSDLMTVYGSSTSIRILKDAGIESADLVAGVVHDERENILTCLLAKSLGAKKAIARISSLEYLREKNLDIFQNHGIDALICPERIAANECIDLISQSAATEVYDFSGGKLSLLVFHIDDNSEMVGKNINDVYEDFHLAGDCKVMSVSRNSYAFIPNEHEQFMAGDFVYTAIKPKGKKNIIEAIGSQNDEIHNVMLVGGGRIARMMMRDLPNINFTVIEIDNEKCNMLADEFGSNVLVINGDAREVELLEDEYIKDMNAFVAITNNSETNIMTGLLAKRFGVKKVIALMENMEYIDLAQRFGIDSIINKKLITASYTTRYTLDAEVSDIKFLSGIDAEVLEISAKAGSPVTRKPISHIQLPYGAIIGGIVRGYESHIATPDFQIREGDKVMVLCLSGTVEHVIKYFNKKLLF